MDTLQQDSEGMKGNGYRIFQGQQFGDPVDWVIIGDAFDDLAQVSTYDNTNDQA